ncbi:hypothetical protein PssvBMR1_gp50 [Pseudomonas phage MR1]|uniref:Uncharacterized protein n=1 Tax=Pseudomonas phage MR1 TaxID=2711169 RepID=A0A6M3TA60_9CAUD|nr:hypothetical protein PssvBMR1_gp50 [Pseudomonas phage MR1]
MGIIMGLCDRVIQWIISMGTHGFDRESQWASVCPYLLSL